MTRGIKVRLIAFVVLSAVGIIYVGGSYLGVVDRILGRGLSVHATLPDSGGLFVGSEVTYRGFKVGKVSAVTPTKSGIRLTLALQDGTKIPKSSPIAVHNLSAVGEQYLDIVPDTSNGPYLKAGDTLAGSAASLPIGEDVLLTKLSGLVNSVDRNKLTTVISELGDMFRGTAPSLQRMVDSSGVFIQAAKQNQQSTIDLFDTGKIVLQTQAAHEQDIRGFAKDLADLTQTLRTSDGDLRNLLQGGPATVREVNSLLTGLEPTLPIFLSNLVTVNQVMTTNVGPLEELLVSFPRAIAAGFTGTPGDGYGHINLQLNNSVGPCTAGYLPSSKWRPATDLTDLPVDPSVHCASGPPINMRGTKYAPSVKSAGSTGRSYRVSTYDAKSGVAPVGGGKFIEMGNYAGPPAAGDNSWQWLLVGPAASGE